MKTLEELRWEVIKKGQRIGDRTKIADKIDPLFTGPLKEQYARDKRAEYKFYDALGMWLGQADFWGSKNLLKLRELAEDYLAEPEVDDYAKLG